MKMKKVSCRYGFGNKGFIFALDATIAVLVTMIVFVAVVYYSSNTTDSLIALQLSRTSSDIITMLYYDGSMALGVPSTVQTNMEELLPPNYDMAINFTRASGADWFQVGNDVPDKDLVVSGKRIFARKGSNGLEYIVAQYWIWLK